MGKEEEKKQANNMELVRKFCRTRKDICSQQSQNKSMLPKIIEGRI